MATEYRVVAKAKKGVDPYPRDMAGRREALSLARRLREDGNYAIVTVEKRTVTPWEAVEEPHD